MITIHESLLHSAISDIVMFGSIVGGFLINHIYIGSRLLSILMAFFLFFAMTLRAKQVTTEYESPMDFVEDIMDDLNIGHRRV
jgi:hypothetical protein